MSVRAQRRRQPVVGGSNGGTGMGGTVQGRTKPLRATSRERISWAHRHAWTAVLPERRVRSTVHTRWFWDLWHARLGHAGGDIAKFLPLTVNGVQISSNATQTRCESCIMAKHPRQPYPSSTSLPTRGFLELIHTDLCGPFPVPTLHGKRYFIVMHGSW